MGLSGLWERSQRSYTNPPDSRLADGHCLQLDPARDAQRDYDRCRRLNNVENIPRQEAGPDLCGPDRGAEGAAERHVVANSAVIQRSDQKSYPQRSS